MQCNCDENAIMIVDGMIALLNSNGEAEWANVLSKILDDYKQQATKQYAALLFLKTMQGGMGSLLDLVLHKNKKPLIDENNKLDELRHALYEECMKIRNSE